MEHMISVETEKPTEEAVVAEVQKFHSCLYNRLASHAVQESSKSAVVALQQLTELHTRTVQELNEKNDELQKQLFDAAVIIEKLGSQLSRSGGQQLEDVQRSFTVDVLSASRGETTDIDVRQRNTEETGEQKTQPHSREDFSSDAFATVRSDSSHQEEDAPEDGIGERAITTSVWCGHRTSQPQHAWCVGQIKDLTLLLEKVVRENVSYRRQLKVLQATTIPVEEHKQLLEERDMLFQECSNMRVELQRLHAEMEVAIDSAQTAQKQQRAMVIGTTMSPLRGDGGRGRSVPPPQEPEGPVHPPTGLLGMGDAHTSEDRSTGCFPQSIGEEALLHTGLWQTAMRELEQQAALAASQLSSADRLRELENRITDLMSELDAARTAYEKLEAEDKCVREDCEQLTFRNAVLSQQVSSLLVQVERQCRSICKLSRQQDEQREEIETSSDVEMLSDNADKVGNPQRRVERGQVAAAARTLLQQRKDVASSSMPFSPIATSRGTEQGVSHVLDVVLPQQGSLEVEGGLRAAVGVFAQGSRRSVHLRNLGTPPCTLESTQLPRLPPCEELSGVALARPSTRKTICLSKPKDEHVGCSTSSSATTRSGMSTGFALTISEDEEENKRFAELLREDESLERFSINSARDLIKRNQELLKQLYVISCRMGTEGKQPQPSGSSKEESGSGSSSDTEAAQPQQRKNRKRRRESTPQTNEECDNQGDQGERESDQSQGSHQACSSGQVPCDPYAQLELHVHDRIEAALNSHEAQLTLVDKGLASALVDMIELRHKFCSVNDGQFFENYVDSTTKDNIIASLVRLCLRQGVRVADQVVELVVAQQCGNVPAMKDCWSEAQRVLKQSVQELGIATSQLPRVNPVTWTARGVSSAPTMGPSSEIDEAQLLHSITQLLRTASLREHTVQRVLKLAARRMRATRRACDTLKSGVQQVHEGKQDGGERLVEDSDSDTLDAAPGDTENNSEGECHEGSRWFRAQIDAAHARYQKLLATHHEERKQHTVLLDRMWRLEEEMVTARRERQEAMDNMAAMMRREDYEATIADLDNANAAVETLKERVKQLCGTQGALQQQLDCCRREREEEERRYALETAQITSQLAQKDETIAHYVAQQQHLEKRISELQLTNQQLGAQVVRERHTVSAREAELKEMETQRRRSELVLLEQQCTQELLLSMFPGDTILERNGKLIYEQRIEKEALSKEVASLKVELNSCRRDLADRQAEIQRAVQGRQEAELLLQEVTLELGGPSHKDSGETETNDSSVTTFSVSQQMELESLRQANASLLLERQRWMERESLLREQLDALSRDPVSENARRYGLQGTRSFEEQLAKMEERYTALLEKLEAAEALRTNLKELEEEKACLFSKLDESERVASEQEQVIKTLQENVQKMREQLVEKEESHDAVRITLAEKEEMIINVSDAIRALEGEIKNLDRSVSETEKERDKLLQDNLKLIESVKALTEAVKKKEAERKAAQAALAQGLAGASASAQRWKGRNTAGGGSPAPISITGSLSLKPS